MDRRFAPDERVVLGTGHVVKEDVAGDVKAINRRIGGTVRLQRACVIVERQVVGDVLPAVGAVLCVERWAVRAVRSQPAVIVNDVAVQLAAAADAAGKRDALGIVANHVVDEFDRVARRDLHSAGRTIQIRRITRAGNRARSVARHVFGDDHFQSCDREILAGRALGYMQSAIDDRVLIEVRSHRHRRAFGAVEMEAIPGAAMRAIRMPVSAAAQKERVAGIDHVDVVERGREVPRRIERAGVGRDAGRRGEPIGQQSPDLKSFEASEDFVSSRFASVVVDQ